MRWIVGDVQGCAAELEALLDAIRFDPAGDELISVGDLVNRGPDSVGALRLWRDVGGRGVIGNHEVYALGVASGRVPRRRDTLGALLEADDRAALLEPLRALPALLFLEGGDGFEPAWVVHAGVHPAWTDLHARAEALDGARRDAGWLEREDLAVATRIRCCTPEGRMSDFTGPPRDRPGGFEPWDVFYPGPVRIVHGHWARRGLYRGPHSLGLDSGCVYGGALTAWCQEEDRLVQVPARGR